MVVLPSPNILLSSTLTDILITFVFTFTKVVSFLSFYEGLILFHHSFVYLIYALYFLSFDIRIHNFIALIIFDHCIHY